MERLALQKNLLPQALQKVSASATEPADAHAAPAAFRLPQNGLVEGSFSFFLFFFFWVRIKGLSCHNKEAILCTIGPHYV